MAMIENGRRWMRQQGAPLAMGIAATLVVSSFFTFFTGWFARLFAFNPGDSLTRPWSILTYPFVHNGLGDPLALLFFIFLLLWVFWTGSFLERDAGIKKAALFWVGMTVLPALLLGVGMRLSGGGAYIAGPFLPLSAITVYWGVRNKEARVMLWGILPIKGIYIAALSVAGTFFVWASPIWWLGFFAVAHTGLAWWIAQKGLLRAPAIPKKTKAQVEREERFEEEVRRRKRERDEQERLRRLLEGPTGGEDR